MKIFSYLFAAVVVTAITACSRPLNSEEIYQKVASGVVLIVNDYYYSVTLPTGEELYFTDVDDEGRVSGLTDDAGEAYAHSNVATGTGFFITTDGQIMTNHHVARPEVSESNVKLFLRGVKKVIKSSYQERINELTQQFHAYAGQDAMQAQIYQRYQAYQRALESVDDMDMSESDIHIHSKLYVVYNNQHVLSYDDMAPCDFVAVANDGVDLAIIQLEDGTTPEDAHVFSLRDEAADKPLTLDQKLYMIGFNRGFTIGKTSSGEVQSQIYSGNVTQRGDGESILYSIPSLHGSSGSPVVNEYGFLVAVNYAGYDGTQGFNYGIPSKKIRQFLQEY
ncbi:MAG: trypsin-like peptidase domain-containing protein [Bacteroidaceae bacterium]|nr:trypsin-like peptidase domain-containing protein [Bacteroidaceae bacterium]